MLETYALVTLDNAKDFLGITDSSKDDLLEILINQATDYIENECNRRFESTVYTEQEYSGRGIKTIQLDEFPVITFTLLEVNNNTDNTDNWSEIDTDNYWVEEDTGILTKTTNYAKGNKNYRATYTAGFTTIPHDLQFACMMLVSETFNKRKAMGVKSESLGDHSLTFESIKQENSAFTAILSNYRAMYI